MVPGSSPQDDNLTPSDKAPPSSPKPLLRRISQSLESRGLLTRSWSTSNVPGTPSLLQRFGGTLSLWSSTPAVNSAQGEGGGNTTEEKREEEEEVEVPDYRVVVEEDSPDEEIPVPDLKSLSLSRRNKGLSINNRLQRSMSNLSLFKAPRIKRKRKKDGFGKGVEPFNNAAPTVGDDTDFDFDVFGSEAFVELRYQDTARTIYTDWRKSAKVKNRLNADSHYTMHPRHQSRCKQM